MKSTRCPHCGSKTLVAKRYSGLPEGHGCRSCGWHFDGRPDCTCERCQKEG